MTTSNPTGSKWSNPGADLFLDLGGSRPPRGGVRVAIEKSLRDAIRDGRLARGTRLPASRTLAADLGVARRTVVEVYSQLEAEGWIAGRRGSGTAVVFDSSPGVDGRSRGEPTPLRWRFDLRPGRPDPSSFPRRDWLRALRHALASAPDEAFGYGNPAGELSLRVELASYLGRARGLRVAPQDLVITTGFTQGLGLLARVTAQARHSRRVAMEEPSIPDHREIVRAQGQDLVLLRVDGEGADVAKLEAAGKVGAVVLTPSRQHPTGVALSARRRAQLLEWARASGAYVLEDDYDGEFRYDGHPIGPLQGLAPEQVVYAGTVSKTLAPGIRLGWLAVPHSLREAVVHEKKLADWHTGRLDQLAFAELLRSAGYDRHVRRMRRVYRRRRDLVVRAIADAELGLEVLGTAAGLNLLIPLPDAAAEARVIETTRAAGLGIGGLIEGDCYERDAEAGLIIGFAASSEHNFHPAVEALVAALRTAFRAGS